MDLNVPYSLPPKRQPSKKDLSEDEFNAILQIAKDGDFGVEGGSIDETAAFETAKQRVKNKASVSNDSELTVFDDARKRALNGNNNFSVRRYILAKGEDLRHVALKMYGNANAWVIVAAANDVVNPSSKNEVYEGRELLII